MAIAPGTLLRASSAPVIYRERFTPAAARLQFLTCGEFEVEPGAATAEIAYPSEEALLFVWRGAACVHVDSRGFALAAYDVLYVPKGAPFRITNGGTEPLRLVVTRAPADNVHP